MGVIHTFCCTETAINKSSAANSKREKHELQRQTIRLLHGLYSRHADDNNTQFEHTDDGETRTTFLTRAIGYELGDAEIEEGLLVVDSSCTILW